MGGASPLELDLISHLLPPGALCWRAPASLNGHLRRPAPPKEELLPVGVEVGLPTGVEGVELPPEAVLPDTSTTGRALLDNLLSPAAPCEAALFTPSEAFLIRDKRPSSCRVAASCFGSSSASSASAPAPLGASDRLPRPFLFAT
eukprot:CAMPEP_0180629498 /NCGR_PEP_ID=MMETSP1037_2-20121125/39495_1 /TAXON_ID=632150 /ORGANISM="Azadinium spinosum, Strain 3D9" /LENGTH=144 /DNA_ID=CAMNT_0022650307 /DNA_START=877 /DNA_END=1307 /DNA_ORIENTATION=-